MNKFVVSSMINYNSGPRMAEMDVVMTDNVNKIIDDCNHPTEKMMEVLVHNRPIVESLIWDYKLKKTDIYCRYICIDDDLIPSPYKID